VAVVAREEKYANVLTTVLQTVFDAMGEEVYGFDVKILGVEEDEKGALYIRFVERGAEMKVSVEEFCKVFRRWFKDFVKAIEEGVWEDLEGYDEWVGEPD